MNSDDFDSVPNLPIDDDVGDGKDQDGSNSHGCKRSRHHESRLIQHRRSSPAILPSIHEANASSSSFHVLHPSSNLRPHIPLPLNNNNTTPSVGTTPDATSSSPYVEDASTFRAHRAITIDLERSGITISANGDDDSDNNDNNPFAATPLPNTDKQDNFQFNRFGGDHDSIDSYDDIDVNRFRHRRPPVNGASESPSNARSNNLFNDQLEVRLQPVDISNPLGSTITTPDGGIIFSPANVLSLFDTMDGDTTPNGDTNNETTLFQNNDKSHPYSNGSRGENEFDSEFLDLLKDFAHLELPQYYSEQEVCPLCSSTFTIALFAEHVYVCIKSLDTDEKKQLEKMDEMLAFELAMEEVDDFDYLTVLQKRTGFDQTSLTNNDDDMDDDTGARSNLPKLPPPQNETPEERRLRFQREDSQRAAENKKKMERFLANQALVFNQYKYHRNSSAVETPTLEAECCVCGLLVANNEIDQHVLGCLNTSPQFRLGPGRKCQQQKQQEAMQQAANVAADQFQSSHGGITLALTGNDQSSTQNINNSSTNTSNTLINTIPMPITLPNPFLAVAPINRHTNSSHSLATNQPISTKTASFSSPPAHPPTSSSTSPLANPRLFLHNSLDEDDMNTPNNDLPNFMNSNDDDDEERDIQRRDELSALQAKGLHPRDDDDDDSFPLIPVDVVVAPQNPQNPQNPQSALDNALNAQQIGLMAKMVHDHTTNAPNRDTSTSLHSLLTTFSALGLNKNSLRRAKNELLQQTPASPTSTTTPIDIATSSTTTTSNAPSAQSGGDLRQLLANVPNIAPGFCTETEKQTQHQNNNQQQ